MAHNMAAADNRIVEVQVLASFRRTVPLTFTTSAVVATRNGFETVISVRLSRCNRQLVSLLPILLPSAMRLQMASGLDARKVRASIARRIF